MGLGLLLAAPLELAPSVAPLELLAGATGLRVLWWLVALLV
jgi:hypothetical protein